MQPRSTLLVFTVFLLVSTPAMPADWDWIPANTPETDASFRDIVVDPYDESVWFLRTGDGVYVTRSYGAAWYKPLSGSAGEIAQSPVNPNRVFAGVENKLYRSEDNGLLWDLVHTFPERVESVHVSAADSSVYVGLRWYEHVSTPIPGIYKSDYRGEDWTHYPFHVPEDHMIIWDINEDTVNGVLYVGAERVPHSSIGTDYFDEPFYRSFDGGEHWERVDGPANLQVLHMEIHPTTNDLFYTPESVALCRSSDFGDTYDYLYHLFLLDFTIDPANPNRIYGAASDFGLWDGGVHASWTTGASFSPIGFMGRSVYDVCLNGNGTRLFVIVDGEEIHYATPPHLLVRYVWPDGTGPYATLQDVVSSAQPGDMIILYPGTYSGSGNRDVLVDRAVTIQSLNGDPNEVIIDCQGLGRAFHIISGDAETRIAGLTVRNGKADAGGLGNLGGAMYLEDSSDGPIISACVFESNQALGHGGAVHGGFAGSPVVEYCRFEGNSAGGSGGAYMSGYGTGSCSPVFKGCVFANNTAQDGGGAVSLAMNGQIPASFDLCVFHGNQAALGGGLNTSGGLLQVTDCTFTGDSAATGSEILLNQNQPEIERSVIAFGQGGSGVACQGGAAPTLTSCLVFGNSGGDWIDCLSGQENQNGNLVSDPLFCDPAGGDYRVDYLASPCLPWNNMSEVQIGALWAGCNKFVTSVPDHDHLASTRARLFTAPNPFNPVVMIDYELVYPGPVTITIHDLRGRRLATLVDCSLVPGNHHVKWNGRDADGRDVGSGPYLCRMKTPREVITRKLLLVR